MKVEIGANPRKLLLSLRKSITQEEKACSVILGQLYRGYAGLILNLRVAMITLWILKWESQLPKLKTVFIGG